MVSHVYLAEGYVDGVRVMKIGKANNTKQRQYKLTIRIVASLPCPSSRYAFALEAELRDFLRSRCKSFRHTFDWFLFDQAQFDIMAQHFGLIPVKVIDPLLVISPRDSAEIVALKRRHAEVESKLDAFDPNWRRLLA